MRYFTDIVEKYLLVSIYFYKIKIAVYILLLTYCLQVNAMTIPVIRYLVDIDYYLELCVNKLKPEKKCDGKCQLSKEVSSNENKTNKNGEELAKPTLPEPTLIFLKKEKKKESLSLRLNKKIETGFFSIQKKSKPPKSPPPKI